MQVQQQNYRIDTITAAANPINIIQYQSTIIQEATRDHRKRDKSLARAMIHVHDVVRGICSVGKKVTLTRSLHCNESDSCEPQKIGRWCATRVQIPMPNDAHRDREKLTTYTLRLLIDFCVSASDAFLPSKSCRPCIQQKQKQNPCILFKFGIKNDIICWLVIYHSNSTGVYYLAFFYSLPLAFWKKKEDYKLFSNLWLRMLLKKLLEFEKSCK